MLGHSLETWESHREVILSGVPRPTASDQLDTHEKCDGPTLDAVNQTLWGGTPWAVLLRFPSDSDAD